MSDSSDLSNSFLKDKIFTKYFSYVDSEGVNNDVLFYKLKSIILQKSRTETYQDVSEMMLKSEKIENCWQN